jgi:hypothetical protein
VVSVKPRPSALEQAHPGAALGREEILVSEDGACSVLVLEFVFRSEDITVWHGSRTLAVMDRISFVEWLWYGGDYVVDDLAWTVEGQSVLLAISGHRTYAIDGPTVELLAARA